MKIQSLNPGVKRRSGSVAFTIVEIQVSLALVILVVGGLLARRGGLSPDPWRLRFRSRLRRRAQVARDAPLQNRPHLHQHGAGLHRAARAGDAALLLGEWEVIGDADQRPIGIDPEIHIAGHGIGLPIRYLPLADHITRSNLRCSRHCEFASALPQNSWREGQVIDSERGVRSLLQ